MAFGRLDLTKKSLLLVAFLFIRKNEPNLTPNCLQTDAKTIPFISFKAILETSEWHSIAESKGPAVRCRRHYDNSIVHHSLIVSSGDGASCNVRRCAAGFKRLTPVRRPLPQGGGGGLGKISDFGSPVGGIREGKPHTPGKPQGVGGSCFS